jgi:LPXTG-motif cell wall-anchored protein
MFGLRKLSVVLALVLLLAFGAAALAQGTSTVQVAQNAQLGNILVDNKGMTLYQYTKDTPGVSTCTGGCLAAWPALTVPAGTTPVAGPGVTAKLGTITRADDGALQVTANDMPLYYWAKDKAAGDVTGQGVGGIWFVADPAGAMVKTALAAATPAAGAAAAATAAPTAAAPAATAAPAAAAAAATAEPTAAAPAPAKLPTTGAGTNWLLPALALAALLALAGFGLTQARRTR